jgi:TonB family protein
MVAPKQVQTVPKLSLILFAAALFVLPASPARAQQSPELEALAARAAKAIQKSRGKSKEKLAVVVADFSESSRPRNQLGVIFADEFSLALARSASDLDVVDRQFSHRVLQEILPPQPDLRDGDTALCFCQAAGASAVVTGVYKLVGDAVELRVRVWSAAGRKKILEAAAKIPAKQEILQLQAQPAPMAAPPDPYLESLPRAGKNSYGQPKCLDCPSPIFPDDAAANKRGGTVLLRVGVSAEGRPSRVVVIRGSDCIMNLAAVETVRGWSFVPAPGPDGKPAAVQVIVEVSFRILR